MAKTDRRCPRCGKSECSGAYGYPCDGVLLHVRDRSPRCTSHTTSAGGNPPGPIGGFIDLAPATCTLVHVVVARARDLASCWEALASRVEVMS